MLEDLATNALITIVVAYVSYYLAEQIINRAKGI